MVCRLINTMNLIINKILKESMTNTEAAGVLIICTGTKRALIEKRNDKGQYWGTFGGMVDSTDPTIKDAVIRELKEETGYVDSVVLLPIFDFLRNDFTYHTYLGFVEEEFVPKLSSESIDYAWCNWQELWEIEPKLSGFSSFLENVGDKLEAFLIPKDTLVESILKEARNNEYCK